MSKTYREPHIQSLRALAALMVLIYHADFLPGGYIGVDIFYVISGYLITNLLLRELEKSNGLNFSAFYARRFKRLLPASFLVILATGFTAWLLLPATSRADLGRDLIAASTYISNFLFALWNADYQNLGATPSPFIHFWSLAVEEQFYIFWPFLLYIFFKFGGRRGVLRGIIAIALLSFAFSLYLTENSPIWSFYLLPTRAWEMAVGGLLIFISHNKRSSHFNKPQLGLLAILFIGIGSFLYDDQTAFPGTAALAPVVATALLILSREKWPPFLDSLSSRSLTQWLGRISYPLYLWHWPVFIIPELYLVRELTIIEKSVAFLFVLLLADLTNRFVEEPLRGSETSPRKIYKLSAIATAFAVTSGILIITSYNSNITSSSGFAFDVDEVRVKPIINQDGCHIHLGQTVSPLCEYGDRSSAQTIVLYGDSHAAQWMPALDIVGRKYNMRILSLTKSGCPSAEVIKEPSSQYVAEECQAFRDSTIERIRKERPRAVILSGMQPFTAPNSTVDSRNWWLAGEAKAFARLKGITDFPIYLTDTPLPRLDIPTCLAKAEKIDCDTARPISPEVAPGFKAINPTPWLCDRQCNAVIDGIIVYRDHSHLSVAMSKYLAPYLAEELIRLGVIE
jgi:peptidoglycan/LPS O-acetylase OafA/YrhL